MDRTQCWYKDVCPVTVDECLGNYCVRLEEMRFLVSHSGLPENKWFPQSLSADDVDYDAYCKLAEIKDNIVDFVQSGANLYIYSKTTGNGKTTWAIKLLLKYFDQIWAGNGFRPRGLFISVPMFLTQLKNFDNKSLELERVKDELPKVDLVVWDDVASTNMSNYDHSQLISYIDQRVLAGKSNIYTSNMGINDIIKPLGIRLASRIWNNSVQIEFRGGDKR